jgi:hypothetical protein
MTGKTLYRAFIVDHKRKTTETIVANTQDDLEKIIRARNNYAELEIHFLGPSDSQAWGRLEQKLQSMGARKLILKEILARQQALSKKGE